MQFIKAAFVAVLIAAPSLAFAFTISTRTSFNDRHVVKLHMVGEIVEGANAALNALPLLAGPTAALAAGQVALSQKKKIESEVEYAERELDDVKRRLKNTDTLINGSFGLAVVSAGFVAVQAFSGESSLPQTTTESIEGLKEFVLPSTSQQLAVEDKTPVTESIKGLMKVDTSISEKKSVTSDSEYNSLYKSIESAGKEGGQTIENSKVPGSISQISTAPASEARGSKNSDGTEKTPATSTIMLKNKPDELIAKTPTLEKALPVKPDELVAKTPAPEKSLSVKPDDLVAKTPTLEKSLSATATENKIAEVVMPPVKTENKIAEVVLSPVKTENKIAEIVLSPVKATIEKSPGTPTVAAKDDDAELTSKTPSAEKVSTAIATDAANEDSSSSTKTGEINLSKEAPTSQTKAAIDSTAEKNQKLEASDEKSLGQKIEAAGKTGSDSGQPTTIALADKKTSNDVDDLLSKKPEAKADAVTAAPASTEKVAPILSPKVESSDEKTLAQRMEAAGKAGSDLIQPTITTVTPDKPTLDSLPAYDSLFKKIEAAGKTSDERANTADVSQGQISPSGSNVIASSSEGTDASKPDKIQSEAKELSKVISPDAPSKSSIEDTPRDSSNGGVYMKEAVSALSSLTLPKLTVPSSNSLEYKLPSFSTPEMSMPSFNMPDFKMPTFNIAELSVPHVNLPSMEDVPIAAKVAAGVVAVGGAGVVIALSLNGEETVGSTMPIGAKKKGSSYLEGLSRSSTSLPNKDTGTNGSSSGSNSYLSNLAATTVSPPQGQAANAPYDFSPKPFDSRAESSINNDRPTVTAMQESNVSPSFNFAPSANTNTDKDSSQYTVASPVNGGSNLGAPNGEKKTSPSFNFSPNLFNLANQRGSPGINGKRGSDNVAPKPEPPMGGESANDSSKNDKYDWGNSSVDGGYVWRDPLQQKPGSGVASYLDNLEAKSVDPNPYAAPSNPNSGSYNSYLDAMNRPPQQYQDSNQPPTIKTFSKTPRTGSYVDSL